MFKNIAEKAKGLTSKVDLEVVMETAKQATSEIIDSGKSKTDEIVEQNWPEIEDELIRALLALAEDGLRDDKIVEALLDNAYDALPLAVRLVLSRAKFTEIFMAQREPLLLKIQERRSKEMVPVSEN